MSTHIEKKFNVLVTAEMAHLSKSCNILEDFACVDYKPEITNDELKSTIKKYNVIVTNIQQKITREIIDNAPKLELIATPSTGTDHIDLEYARERGITVQSLKKDYDVLKSITATAELAFALILASVRKLPQCFEEVKKGNWERDKFRGREVQGRVLGIVGYGRLGEIISRFAKGFDMNVIACDPDKKITDDWVKQVGFKELLSSSEIISIHVHLDDTTRNLFGQAEFDMMEKKPYLINTSRGAIIDEDAFLNALFFGKISGAGIDVLADELDGQIINNKLVQYARENDNLIITPHIGGCTYDSQEKAYLHMASKVVDFLREA